VSAAAARRFTVGFSYAGEDRPVVAPVAERLAARLGRERLLFDRFHEAELARPDLDVYLPRLYRDQTELIVVVLSPDYPRKRWCGLEWRWIRQLILGAAQERIMLLQIGDPGDLSELGIVAGDGYLDISRRSAEAIAAAILERLGQLPLAPSGPLGLLQLPGDSDPGPESDPESGFNSKPNSNPVPAPSVSAHTPVAPRPRRLRGLPLVSLVAIAAALFGGAWLLGRPLLARWQRHQGDQAFLAYTKQDDPAQLQRAQQAWRQAAQLDPRQVEAQARLGFLDDFLGELGRAESRWRRAVELVPQQDSPQAQAMRNGLANVLAQRPDQRLAALNLYDADRFYPRSAMDAAMLRWSMPGQLPQALDAINESALAPPLKGDQPPLDPWGFKSHGAIVLFESRAQQRCLLAAVRATTAHLAGAATAAPPLAGGDCQGTQTTVGEVLCDRLLLAQPTNPRAAASRAWLGCPAERPQTRR
jgi:tetratricopeptide (TPR) repeat protein